MGAYSWRLAWGCCGQATPSCSAHARSCWGCLVLAHSRDVCRGRALYRQGDHLIAPQQDQTQHPPDIALRTGTGDHTRQGSAL